ncbi:MAG: hypothetical protein ACI89J_003679 [Hyphomicrobiaceae bacterium]|jgi:hypothetical protein
MSPNLIGAIIGFAVGFMGFVFIRLAASRVESKGVGPEPAKTAKILRLVAFVDLAIFTVLGYFVGPMLTSGAN